MKVDQQQQQHLLGSSATLEKQLSTQNSQTNLFLATLPKRLLGPPLSIRNGASLHPPNTQAPPSSDYWQFARNYVDGCESIQYQHGGEKEAESDGK